MIPPAEKGRQARREGKPMTANPYPEVILYGDAYPGPWGCWDAGWRTEDAMIRHDERLKHD